MDNQVVGFYLLNIWKTPVEEGESSSIIDIWHELK